MLTALPQAGADSGLLIALAIALAATAAVAVGMAGVARMRRSRVFRTAIGIGAGSGLALLVGALLVGGTLTRPPAAVADEPSPDTGVDSVVRVDLETFQLPTL